MMKIKQQEILRKIGQILQELNDQYSYLSENPANINELELELFSANANFLSDHGQILKKLSSPAPGNQPASTPPAPQFDQAADDLEDDHQPEVTPQQQEPQPGPDLPADEEKPVPQTAPEPAKDAGQSFVFDFEDDKTAESEDELEEETGQNVNPFSSFARDNEHEGASGPGKEEGIVEPVTPVNENDAEKDVIRYSLAVDEMDEDDEDGPVSLEPDPEASLEDEDETQATEKEQPEQYQAKLSNEFIAEDPENTPQKEHADVEQERSFVPETLAEPVEFSAPEKTEAPEPTPEPAKEPAVLTLNQRISEQLKEKAAVKEDAAEQSVPSGPPISDLKAAINLNDKLLFVKELFTGYSLAYSEAVEILNRFHSYAEADTFLQRNYAGKNSWATKQKAADKFYDLLRRRYA